MKNFYKNFLVVLVILFPVFTSAGIIPCTDNCGYNDLIKLAKNLIDWVMMISVPIATGVFAWAGFKYMTSGVVDQKNEAKEMLKKVLIGFVVILSAWLIVSTLVNALINSSFRSAVPM